MRLDRIRDLFPVTRRYAYLNHAAAGPLPQPVVDAMGQYLSARCETGSQAVDGWDERCERIRRATAEFVGAHRDEITFTGSVSHGLNLVAAGLDWQPGDNLICAESEFPANIYPWTNLRRRGVEVRLAPASDNRILAEDVARLMDSRTRLVAISFVEFGTGYRNDLDGLAELCHSRGAYLCVDGIQALGALQLSVQKTPVDFLATQAAKWLLGPIGAGFLFVRRDLLDRLEPVMTGWRSVVDRDDYYCYDSPLRCTGERLEPGSLNYVGLVGLGAALELLISVGPAEVEARVMNLTDYLIAGLEARDCIIATPIEQRSERSGIVCFRHPDVESEDLAQSLDAADVIVCRRGEVIRVSPHFYNSEADLDRLLGALPDRRRRWSRTVRSGTEALQRNPDSANV